MRYLVVFFLCLSFYANSQEQVYLFSYFIDNGQDGLHFAYSLDGLKWQALNNENSYLKPAVGKDKLMRDPFILQGKDGTFHAVWTSGWWDKYIGYASSKDLINWSEQTAIPVMAHEPEAKNCWAPEMVYDEANGSYIIFWATTIPGRFKDVKTSESEKGLNHRMYYTTTKDFKTFSEIKIFFNPDFSVIDADILLKDKTYFMFLKNENSNPPEKNVRITKSENAGGPYPSNVSAPITGNYWAEGPSSLQVDDYVYVYFDKYTQHKYGAVRSKDMEKWEDVSDQVSFPEGVRHGSAFKVSKAVFDRLKNYFTFQFDAVNLRCENKQNPVSIENQTPRFSWQIKASERNTFQTAYHILVANDKEKLDKNIGNIWDSKIVKSDESILVEYGGSELKPEKKYYWKVKLWNQTGKESEWSEPSSLQMGLMKSENWENAKWICYETLPDSLKVIPGVHLNGDKLGPKAKLRPVIPLFRKEFTIQKTISSAMLYICGLGQYEASINGKNVRKNFMSPGWTDYEKTCLYNTYNVTNLIKTGKNAIGAIVGNGFYNINRERYRKLVIAYDMPKMIAKLKIVYSDGSQESIVTGEDWKCSASPVTYTSIFGGEDYDSRLEQTNWDSPGFDDSKWKNALLAAIPKGKLVAEIDNPVGVAQVWGPKKVIKVDSVRYLYDFGQNASGIVEIKVKGQKGQVIKLIPAELIKENNDVNQRNSGSPYYFAYTLKGDGIETWKPSFTYYGFRYVMVNGAAPGTENNPLLPQVIDMKFLHTRNTSRQVGSFSCSNALFNNIFDLVNWAIKSNIQSVVTDCPHREKLGWLEQNYLMGGSMHYNYDLYQLYRQVILDMMDTQLPDGLVPDIAPEFVTFDGGFRDSPEWGSAAVILPWMLYQWYGDKEILKTAWPMMKKYTEYLGSKSKGHILSHGLGDWYDLGPKFPGIAQLTPKELTATAIYFYDVKVLSQIAEVLKLNDDAKKMSLLAEGIKKAFNDKFFNSQSKVYSTGSQTAMSMPLCLGLVDDVFRKNVLQNLVDSISKSNNALTAGDIGFHFLVKALGDGGESQLLFKMNNREDVPGYGFQIKKGATALTESWAALREVSNNHLMLGHIMEWFYSGLAGIKQEGNSIAYKNIIIKPELAGDITHAKGSYQSPYGPIQTEWTRHGKILELSVIVPVNCTATLYFPTIEQESIYEGPVPISKMKDIQFLRQEEGKTLYKIGSGKYLFKMNCSE